MYTNENLLSFTTNDYNKIKELKQKCKELGIVGYFVHIFSMMRFEIIIVDINDDQYETLTECWFNMKHYKKECMFYTDLDAKDAGVNLK